MHKDWLCGPFVIFALVSIKFVVLWGLWIRCPDLALNAHILYSLQKAHTQTHAYTHMHTHTRTLVSWNPPSDHLHSTVNWIHVAPIGAGVSWFGPFVLRIKTNLDKHGFPPEFACQLVQSSFIFFASFPSFFEKDVTKVFLEFFYIFRLRMH